MSELESVITGLHHITLVTSNEEVNRRFYTEILGLRRVKLTVNQDDIFHRHLFYADEKATTGSAITFFEWPDLPAGTVGLGSPHHLSYTLPNVDALSKWEAWLAHNNVPVSGPHLRDQRISLYLRDPDGVMVELAYPNNEALSEDYIREISSSPPNIQSISQDMRLATFNHASPLTSEPELMAKFFEKLLGLQNSFTRPNPDQDGTSILGIGNEERPDFLRYLAYPKAENGFVGRGSIHHIAMAVNSDEDQKAVMRRLTVLGIKHSGIIDRFYFKSLYFRDLEGNLLEVATKGPGYNVDEPFDKMGVKLTLPSWLEPERSKIEAYLTNTDRSNHGTWPPDYPAIRTPPESI
jgi:glyoxalase family protein